MGFWQNLGDSSPQQSIFYVLAGLFGKSFTYWGSLSCLIRLISGKKGNSNLHQHMCVFMQYAKMAEPISKRFTKKFCFLALFFNFLSFFQC